MKRGAGSLISYSAMPVTFTPLIADEEGVACYLLELGECALLLDCGWDERFQADALTKLAAAVERVDAVLLSHSSLSHVGSLPYAMTKLGLKAPVFATLAACKMAQMQLYDAHQNARAANPDFDIFDLDAVDAAFATLCELKFAQPKRLTGRASGVTIVPHPAGHTIGGCLWHIKVQAEEVLYVPEYNHQKERHLPAGSLDQFLRPSLLIMSARNAILAQETRRERLTQQLITLIKAAISRRGDVLLPSDASGRSIELLCALEFYWRADKRLHSVPIVFLHATAFNTVEYAKSQIEWMCEDMVQAFDVKHENPLAFRHVYTRHDLASVASLPSPKVIVTTSPSLETGFASELLPSCCAQPSALLLLTQRPPSDTVGAALLSQPAPAKVTLNVRELKPLVGGALAAHQDRVALRRSAKAELEKNAKAVAEAKEEAATAEVEGVEVVDEAGPMAIQEGGGADTLVALVRSPSLDSLGSHRKPLSSAVAAPRYPLVNTAVGVRHPGVRTLEYAERFGVSDEWGVAVSEAEWKNMEVRVDQPPANQHPAPSHPISSHPTPYHTVPSHPVPSHPTHPIPSHPTQCHAMPCIAMPCHTAPYHTIPCRNMAWLGMGMGMAYHATPYHTMLYRTTQCLIVPYHTIPAYPTPSHPTSHRHIRCDPRSARAHFRPSKWSMVLQPAVALTRARARAAGPEATRRRWLLTKRLVRRRRRM